MSILNRRIFYIDSHNRTNPLDSHSQFYYEIQMPKTEIFDRVVMLSCVIPKSYYLVRAGFNTFHLVENGVSTLVTIEVGNYSASSFRTYMGNLLTNSSSQGWVYSLAFSTTTGKFTYSVSNNGILQPSFVFTTNVYEQFGFNPNTICTFSSGAITSTNVVKFKLKDTLFIHSDICSNGSDDILQEIFESASPDYSSIKYQCQTPDFYAKKLATQNNNIYSFTLTDEDGKLVDLNGLNIVFTLCVYGIDKTNKMFQDYMQFNTRKQLQDQEPKPETEPPN